MATDSWSGVSADWNNAADWSGGAPSAATTATIAGPGSFLVTLYGTGSAAALAISAPGAEFYDAGLLNLGGLLSLQAGTLALAYGEIAGGTLALAGGQFLSTGGTLAGVAVQGTLDLSAAQSSLVVTGGLALSGLGGSGQGSIALTGGYASLDCVGSQTLANAIISFGASGSQPGQAGAATLAIASAGGATAGATLTLASNLWLRGGPGQGQIVVGNTGPLAGGALPALLVNAGTITAASQNETLSVAGSGAFINQGTIGISNGATLALATAAFSNTGTITVANATLALGGTFASSLLAGLGNITLSSGQVQIAGTLQNAGTLTLGTGTRLTGSLGALSLAGTIAGGTVTDAGGGLAWSAGTGVLDGVIYAGTLALPAAGAVTLTNGARVTAPGGGAGSIAATGAGSTLFLRGAESLDGVQIALGSNGAAATIATADTWLASTATTATLGPHAGIVQSGTNAALQALGWSGVPGIGAADTLVNQGSITAGVAGGRFALSGYGTIINQGAISVFGGDTLAVTAAQFANTGTLTAGAGGTLLLGQAAPAFGAPAAWSNTGQIAISGGTLVLAGALATAQLGTITETSGTVTLTGTLSNAGATLALGGHGALALRGLSLAGTIAGGTIIDTAGALLATGTGGALLDGVDYQGTLALNQAASFLRIRDGLALNGTASILGAGATLDFQGSQSFDHATILLGAAGAAASIDVAHDPSQAGATTLTLGSGLTITQAGQHAAIGRAGGTGLPGDAIVNQGTITAATPGGTLTLGGPGFINQGLITLGQNDTLCVASSTFANTGTIAVAGGLLSVGGSLTLAQLGRVSVAGGALAIGGTLDLAGGTLAIGQGSADGRLLLTGTIQGGTITDGGAGLAATGQATLANVNYLGTLDFSRPFATLNTAGGLAVEAASGVRPGTILLTGAQTRLLATGSETIDAAQIALGSVAQTYAGQKLAAPELAAAAGVALTLGAACTLTLAGTAGTLGDAGLGQWNDSIVNAGQIVAAGPGTLTLGATNFINTGSMAASGGAVLALGDAAFTNAGTLSIGAGSVAANTLYAYYAAPNGGSGAAFTNTGTIAMQGGLLQQPTANGLFPQVPLANLAGGVIEGAGLVFAQIANNGTIEAHAGGLYLAQSVLGTGALLIDSASTLELAGSVAANQTVRFLSNTGTLKIDTPTGFAGTLAGLQAGDVLDLPGQVLTGVGLSSGTLVASTATQNYRFASTTPLGGELSAGHDLRGGATISFLAQTPGAAGTGIATIPIAQPGMLFWASPAGDAFQGAAANINGGHISNWGGLDSLDITDLNPATAAITVSQSTGLATLMLTDGTLSAGIGLAGTFSPGAFHLARDGHGGTLLTYGHA